MRRQIFIIIGLCLISSPLFAAKDSSIESVKKEFVQSPLEFGLDLEYYAPVYKNYVYAVDPANGKAGTSTSLGKAAQVSLEWLPFGNKIGKLGIGVGTGFAAITDTAITQIGTITTTNAETGATTTTTGNVERPVNLYVVPAQAFLSYRLDFFQNQLIVPFAKFGASANWIRQTVDGGASYHMAYGMDYAFGGEICLNAIEGKAGREFDSRFGVNGTYIILEYLNSSQLNKTSTVNLAYDAFRFGLRFEF